MTTSKRFSVPSRRVGKSAYGDGGPGSPVSLMTGHLKKLCHRYRQVQPFPLKPMDFFETVFPIELFLERTANDPRWVNLAKSINVESIGHFHVEGRDETHETFWVRNPNPVPAPRDLSITLVFPKSNPHFATVNAWVGKALEIHETIEEAMEYLRVFVGTVEHPANVEGFWPELRPFIGQFPDTVWNHPVKVRPKEVSIPAPKRRAEITDLLATCSLLSDIELAAWVKFPVQGET